LIERGSASPSECPLARPESHHRKPSMAVIQGQTYGSRSSSEQDQTKGPDEKRSYGRRSSDHTSGDRACQRNDRRDLARLVPRDQLEAHDGGDVAVHLSAMEWSAIRQRIWPHFLRPDGSWEHGFHLHHHQRSRRPGYGDRFLLRPGQDREETPTHGWYRRFDYIYALGRHPGLSTQSHPSAD
jgi:hypothetical protein